MILTQKDIFYDFYNTSSLLDDSVMSKIINRFALNSISLYFNKKLFSHTIYFETPKYNETFILREYSTKL